MREKYFSKKKKRKHKTYPSFQRKKKKKKFNPSYDFNFSIPSIHCSKNEKEILFLITPSK